MNRNNRKSSSSTTESPSKPVAIRSTPQLAAQNESTANAVQTLIKSYQDTTPSRLKLIDAFCVFLMISGVIQFVYCFAITNFPFNSFIAGFAATVGQFVLSASLRIQCNKANQEDFPSISPERAFGDFVFGSVILHFFVVNFLG